MRLASYEHDGKLRFGAVLGEELLDLGGVDGSMLGISARSILELIEAGAPALEQARDIVHAVAAGRVTTARLPLSEVLWRAPVLRPSKICCVALNNSANRDRIISGPSHPATFIKPSSALIGHLQAIECRADYGRTHPEPELALVIAKTARNIRAAQAYEHVFGYTIHNDITSPTMRGEDTFHYRAIHPRADDPTQAQMVDTWVSYPGRYKCSDTFACMGPWLVTRDEIADPHNLAVSCSHQGRMITQDNTANLFYKTPQLLEFLSSYMTLLPGDVVSLGTALQAAATGGAVQNVDLNRTGGPVSVTIECIGTLTNSVSWI